MRIFFVVLVIASCVFGAFCIAYAMALAAGYGYSPFLAPIWAGIGLASILGSLAIMGRQ